MRRYRTDGNQTEIVTAWRALGWYVQTVGAHALGYDAIGHKDGRTVFAEIKNPKGRGKELTDKEKKIHAEMAAHGIYVILLCCVADLAQIDAHARERYEGRPPRTFYPEQE